MNIKLSWFFAATISGLLLYVGWVPLPAWITLLFAFVPLLWAEHSIAGFTNRTRRWVWAVSYLCFLVWNVSTTWWVGNTTSPMSGVLANVLNALLMTIPFMLYHVTRLKLGNRLGYLSLPIYWITFEFLHLRWDLSWPWLTLGNGLAYYPSIVQWYEYTGILGGSLWLLTVNILVWMLVRNYLGQVSDERRKQLLLYISAATLIPYTLSIILYYTTTENQTLPKQNTVVVQPNIDPYETKFDTATLDQQLQTLITLTRMEIDSATDYVVFPETALPQGIYEDQLEYNADINKLRAFLRDYPKAQLVTGISGYLLYADENHNSPTARKLRNGSYYDAFNTGLQFNYAGNFQLYHKSKLVPGVEQLPYPALFKFLNKYAIDMGGTTGSLGKQDYRSVFWNQDSIGVAPVICYESIYGEFCNEYIQRGAHIIHIITNDGWWGVTPGHVQHLYYGTLRAIETRRPIARSANTGISCFVDIRGEILQPQAYGIPAVINDAVRPETNITFYVRFGDYIGRIALIGTLILILLLIVKRNKIQ